MVVAANPDRKLSPQERTERLLELAQYACSWCGYDLHHTNARPSRDLLVPRVKGGVPRLENEVAACGSCSQKRGSAGPSAWIETCRRERGVEPNVAMVASQLERLAGAIEQEGGMRKMRDYVARELTRVRSLQAPSR